MSTRRDLWLSRLMTMASIGYIAAIAFGERIGHLDAATVKTLVTELETLPAAMAAGSCAFTTQRSGAMMRIGRSTARRR